MKSAAHVLDTQTLVWFAMGLLPKLSRSVFQRLTDESVRIVVPSYVLQEIQIKFPSAVRRLNDIPIAPTALLRILHQCSNARILSRGEAMLAREFKLDRMRRERQIDIDVQDIPIAAAVLVVRDYHSGPTILVTSDQKLGKWALAIKLSVMWS